MDIIYIKNRIQKFIITTVFLFCYFISVFINPAFAKTENIKELQAQIQALQKRVEELEGEKQATTKRQQNSTSNDPFDSYHDRWDPFSEIHRMQAAMDQMFRHSFSNRRGGSSNVSRDLFSSNMSYDNDFEIKEKKDKYILEVDMTGLNKEKMDIEINEHSITIKGERSIEEKKTSDNRYYSSTSISSFMRTIPLPTDADTTKVKSDKKGDKLVITLPKKK